MELSSCYASLLFVGTLVKYNSFYYFRHLIFKVLPIMPLKQVHSAFDYVTISNIKNDLIDASVSIVLPLEENEELDYQNCIVVYFDYDFSNPHSKRVYKLFKYYSQTTRELVEKDFIGLGKIQGLYILSNISEEKANTLIEKFNKRHISI